MTENERRTLATKYTSISDLLESYDYVPGPAVGFFRFLASGPMQLIPLYRLQMSVASFIAWADDNGFLCPLIPAPPEVITTFGGPNGCEPPQDCANCRQPPAQCGCWGRVITIIT